MDMLDRWLDNLNRSPEKSLILKFRLKLRMSHHKQAHHRKLVFSVLVPGTTVHFLVFLALKRTIGIT